MSNYRVEASFMEGEDVRTHAVIVTADCPRDAFDDVVDYDVSNGFVHLYGDEDGISIPLARLENIFVEEEDEEVEDDSDT